MNSQAYQLPTFSGLISHDWADIAFLRDGVEEAYEATELDAQVRSGDYFITTATTLDQLSQNIADYNVRAVIEDVVSDLIHLQENYMITKKRNN